MVSMTLSILISCVIWRYRDVLLEDRRYLRVIAAVLVCLSLAAAAYSLLLLKDGVIETRYAMDCCKAAGAGLGFAAGWYTERTKINFDPHTGSTQSKVIRLLAGLAAALLLKESFSLIFGSSILAKMSEYFILVLWVLVIYPYIFSRLLSRNKPL